MASQQLHTGGGTPIEYYSSDEHYAPARRSRRRTTAGDFACSCENCARLERPPEWPRHYMGTPARSFRDIPAGDAWQSFECHLEGRSVDPDLEEELNQLRNEPKRIGSVIEERCAA
jgi:hypothetical protein